MDLNQLNNGIWNLLKKFKSTTFDLTNKGFKQFYTVMQHIENFKNQELFCINYTQIEGFSNSNCTPTVIKSEYFSPSINFNDEYWIQYDILNLLEFLFRNINSHCVKCQ